MLLIQSNYKLECKRAKHPQQALRLGLLAGQALERSGLTLPQRAAKCNPLGLVFQIVRISANNQVIIVRFVGSPEMLTFAYARARSVLGYIIHLLNLYHND